MKKIFFFTLAFALLLSACNMGAQNPAALKQPEVALASPAAQPTSTPVPLAATSTLELPEPQPAAPLLFPTSTSLPALPERPVQVIQFAAGGTWKDTRDSVPLGGFKMYSVNAMQGQVMSVSITGGYFPIQIQGHNGALLCPAPEDGECAYWRGTLPLSQNYYITVISGGMETDFTLRVAINPPGKAGQVFTYTSADASLVYSDQFAPAKTLSMLNHKTEPQLSLQLIDTSSYINTNLGEAYFVLGSSAAADVVAACAAPNSSGMPETPAGQITANGYTFVYSTVADVGAGNYYEQHIYRALYKDTCYEVIYFIHSSNIANYTPGVVKEFDRAGLMGKFGKILASIQFK